MRFEQNSRRDREFRKGLMSFWEEKYFTVLKTRLYVLGGKEY